MKGVKGESDMGGASIQFNWVYIMLKLATTYVFAHALNLYIKF